MKYEDMLFTYGLYIFLKLTYQLYFFGVEKLTYR